MHWLILIVSGMLESVWATALSQLSQGNKLLWSSVFLAACAHCAIRVRGWFGDRVFLPGQAQAGLAPRPRLALGPRAVEKGVSNSVDNCRGLRKTRQKLWK